MNNAQTTCGKFIYISHLNLFFFFHSRTWVTLIDHSLFFSLSYRRSRMRNLRKCLPGAGKNTMLQEQDPWRLYYEVINTWASRKKHILPTCPYCRADPPASVLHQLNDYPSPSPPKKKKEKRKKKQIENTIQKNKKNKKNKKNLLQSGIEPGSTAWKLIIFTTVTFMQAR